MITISESPPSFSACRSVRYMVRVLVRSVMLVVFAAIISGCSAFKQEKELEDLSAEELYAQAEQQILKKRWEAAIETLRALEAKYPYDTYAEQAQLDTIYIYYQSEEIALALAAADRFIKQNPAHPSVDYAYYMKGLVSYNEDNSLFGRLNGRDDLRDRDASLIQHALAAFQDVYTLFPDSQYAAESKKRARYLTNALALNEMTVANYYYSREAYVAAVNRAKSVIENYSSTPSAEAALGMMMFGYQHMNLQDLSDDVRRVLELNFPDSRYLAITLDEAEFTNSYSAAAGKKSSGGWLSSLKNLFIRDDPPAE